MPQQTLLDRVLQMQIDLQANKASVKTINQLLTDVAAHLEQAPPVPDASAINRAAKVLSYSEHQALTAIGAALDDSGGGLLVASRIADQVGLTRSVIVNGLRKLESAGVIRSQSLGMKGTMITPLIHGWHKQFAA